MKTSGNIKAYFALAFATAVSAFAQAADYYATTTPSGKYSGLIWKDSAGTVYTTTPGSADNVYISDSTSSLITIDQNFEVASLSFNNTGSGAGGVNVAFNASSNAINMQVDGDVGVTMYARFAVGNLYVKGDISTVRNGAWLWLGHNDKLLNSLKIDGNLYCNTENTVINVVRNRTEEGAGSFANADTEIKGFLYGTRQFKICSGNTSATTHYDTYLKIGGLNESVTLTTYNTAGANYTANVMFTNDGVSNKDGDGNVIKNCSNTSQISETAGGAKIKLYMNGASDVVQSFTSATIKFTGGVEIMNGRLNLNFKETSGTNHGTLKISGTNGVFGNSYSAAGGTFLFSNVEISAAGKIALKFTDTSTFDSLNLVSDSTATIAYADSYNGKVNFLLEGTDAALSSLIDSTLNDGKGIKIVSWETQTSIAEDSFATNSITSGDRKYVGDFTSAADGLYVKYVAVPEPATIAAICGVFALGIAALRRRK